MRGNGMYSLSQHYREGVAFILCVLMSTLAVITESRAHGIESMIENSAEKTITVNFHYSDGSPASYTKVKVYAPIDDTVEFQNGRTDKNGRFSFVPDATGLWRISQSDGLGHATTLEHDVNIVRTIVKKGNGVKPEQRTNKLIMGILGCSLILNTGFMIQALKRTRTQQVGLA